MYVVIITSAITTSATSITEITRYTLQLGLINSYNN